MFRLANLLLFDPDTLSPANAFYEDMGLISLEDVEFVLEVEEEFGISIPDPDAEGWPTLGIFIDYVQRQLDEAAPGQITGTSLP